MATSKGGTHHRHQAIPTPAENVGGMLSKCLVFCVVEAYTHAVRAIVRVVRVTNGKTFNGTGDAPSREDFERGLSRGNEVVVMYIAASASSRGLCSD